MKKFINKKNLILVICIIVLSILYFVGQKAIDDYVFENDSDIYTEDSVEEVTAESSNVISDEELDFVMEEEEKQENSQSDEEISGEERKIYVYITGEVNNPGVLILNEGSRIVDAINAAGGTTANANTSKINLVYVLTDGMKVNIPNKDELKNDIDFEYITKESGDGESAVSSESDSKSTRDFDIVNINTATQTELETLPGIGPSLALNIINYRKENGKFSSIEDIKNVSGIGDSKFEKIKKYIRV